MGLAVLMMFTTLLVACSGGTPTPPVKKLVDLDKLVANNMTLSQLNTLMTPALKLTGTIYPATRVEKATDGSWIVMNKASDIKPGETAPFQVFLFPPAKATPNNYYAVFFKGDLIIGKAWFDRQGGAVALSYLTGGK